MSSGITDEAAVEGHDLIHNAEVEEQKAHGNQAMTEPDYGEGVGAQTTSTGQQQPQQQPQQQKEGKEGKQGKEQHGHEKILDKVKGALHMKK